MAEAGRLLSGRFRLDERLGAGGFGEVWRGFDEHLEREVAVKVLLGLRGEDDDLVTLFEREAKLAARLSHPGITQVHDYGSEGEFRFLVMELLRGENLHARLRRAAGGLAISDAVDWCAQASDALAVAHQAGVVHRDIKPANLMLLNDGRVKVCDFGTARVAGATGNVTAKGMLTLVYAAPEQIEGKAVDARTDLYALGCSLYQMLTGEVPFAGESQAAIIGGHLSRAPDSPSSLRAEIPAGLDGVVLALLAKDPDDRPGDAAQVAAALRSAVREPQANPPSNAAPTTRSGPQSPDPRRGTVVSTGRNESDAPVSAPPPASERPSEPPSAPPPAQPQAHSPPRPPRERRDAARSGNAGRARPAPGGKYGLTEQSREAEARKRGEPPPFLEEGWNTHDLEGYALGAAAKWNPEVPRPWENKPEHSSTGTRVIPLLLIGVVIVVLVMFWAAQGG